MTPESFNFSIHGLVSGRVLGPGWLVSPVASELGHYASAPLDQPPDLEVTLSFTGGPGCSGYKGSRSWQGKHLVAKWQVDWAADRTPATLAFQGNRASRFIVSKWIVEPAIKIAAHNKGAAMAHAAAVSDGESALLLAGAGGAGKTTWVLRWMEAGHPYMSDDFTLINDGKAMSYVTPLRLGVRNMMLNKALDGLDVSDRIETVFRTLIRRGSLGNLKFYFKASVNRAIKGVKVIDSCPIAGAIMLLPTDRPSSSHGPQKIPPEDMASIMARINREEMHGFEPGIPGFWEDHERMILESLQGKPCLAVPAHALPPVEAMSDVGSLLEWLDRE